MVEAVGVAQAASGRAGRLKIVTHQDLELVGRRPSPQCFAKIVSPSCRAGRSIDHLHNVLQKMLHQALELVGPGWCG